jgi:predicted 2-oxoglutarate/Fe(II)-dependent dioxygenase YbiX
MNKDLRDYVKIYHNHIGNDVCDQTIKELAKVNWHEHTFDTYNNRENQVKLSGDKELSISHDNVSTREVLMQTVWNGLHKYIVEDISFSWFNGWNGFTAIRFNEYQQDKQMAEHCDHIIINEAGTRKGIPVLSILGVLNDDYEGGEFVMFTDEVIPLKKGDMMIFPSVFLYPHYVKPVTKGVRNTFVSWAW